MILVRSLRPSHDFWGKTMIAFKKSLSAFSSFTTLFQCLVEKTSKKKNFPGEKEDQAPCFGAGVLFLRYSKSLWYSQNDSAYIYCGEHASLLSAVAGLTVSVETPVFG